MANTGNASGAPTPTAYVRVRDLLAHDILAGAFVPGERLGIEALARRYLTSTTPIRAALQELQGQGLVSVTPHQGARVHDIDEDYVRNNYELRRAVLGILLPRVVRFVSNADLEHLKALETAFEAEVATGTAMRILEADRHFHVAVYALARNSEACDVMNRTWLLIDALRLKFGYGAGRLKEVVAMHHDLLAALARRDAATATRLFQDVNDSGLNDLLMLMQRASSKSRADN